MSNIVDTRKAISRLLGAARRAKDMIIRDLNTSRTVASQQPKGFKF